MLNLLLSNVPWSLLHLLIPLVVVQRLWELRVSKRHEAALKSRGAVEVGREHYPMIVALHTLWFVGMIVEIVLLTRHISAFWLPLLLIFLLAQALRYWTIRTLGERWTTRVFVLPKARAVTTGPFKYLKHPNYIAVIVELLVFPMIFGAYITAIAASIINLILLLRIRIPAEEKGLREIGGHGPNGPV